MDFSSESERERGGMAVSGFKGGECLKIGRSAGARMFNGEWRREMKDLFVRALARKRELNVGQRVYRER